MKVGLRNLEHCSMVWGCSSVVERSLDMGEASQVQSLPPPPLLSPRDWAWFWSRVDIKSDARCWEWHGRKNPAGYGRYDGQMAHRLALLWFTGRLVPDSLMVLHSCDNPSCVNPNHLMPGTNTDNQRDAKAKGRNARGQSHGKTKLTEDQVRAIRRDTTTPIADLAALYGVCKATISYIKNGRSWKYVR